MMILQQEFKHNTKIMRCFFNIFLLAFLILSGTSCNKILDTIPQDFVSPEEYYRTEDELNRALGGVYRILGSEYLYSNYMVSLINISDEYFYRSTTAQNGANILAISAADPSVNNLWTTLYQGVERANLLLENIDKPEMDEEKRSVIKGEALFLRAYYFFLLVDYFGDVPLKLTTTTSPINTSIERSPVKDVYEQIVKDMKEAENLVLPISSYTYNGHVTQTAVQGILAKVYLTMAGEPLKDVSRYADALEYTEKVINSGLHSLNPSYQQIFINHMQDIYDTRECIWEVEFVGNNQGATEGAGRIGVINGITSNALNWPGFSAGAYNITRRQYNHYTQGDLRRDWNIANVRYPAPTGSATSDEYPVITTTIFDRQIGKWRRKYETGERVQNFTSANFPILRYADVLLMYAEAYYHVNGLGDGKAIEAVNQVRRRGFGLPVGSPVETISVVSNLTRGGAGSGYSSASPLITISFVGGGGSGATGLAVVNANGAVSGVSLVDPGKDYTSVPTVIIGMMWAANTAYEAGTQIYYGNNLYTVTGGGTSTSAAPTHTSGSSNPAITGAEFTYAGARATATASITTTEVDLTDVSEADFLTWVIIPERARELAFETARLHDLKRWGIYVREMQTLRAEILSDPATTWHFAANAANNVSQRNILFPIPNSELNINKLATQNPGW